MIKADHSRTRGERGKRADLTSREQSKSNPARQRRSDDCSEGERDENGKFRDWPVAGTVFD